MLIKIKSWLFFTISLIERLLSWTQTQQEKQVLLPLNMYRGCSNLPMEVFIQCLCEDNLQALVIEGKASEIQLRQAWVMILAEYYELKGDSKEGMEQWFLARDIRKLENHLMLLDRCVEFLKDRWSDSIAESINRLGYPFRPADKENYWIELNTVVQKSKTKFIYLQQMIKELEAQVNKIEDKKPTRDQFDTMLIHIEEMQKVSYSFETMHVPKFLSLEKKYWQQVELIKLKAAKHARTY